MSISPKSLEKNSSKSTAAAARKMRVQSLFMFFPPFQQECRRGQKVSEQREDKPQFLGEQRLHLEKRIIKEYRKRQKERVHGRGGDKGFAPERLAHAVHANLRRHAEAENHHERERKNKRILA